MKSKSLRGAECFLIKRGKNPYGLFGKPRGLFFSHPDFDCRLWNATRSILVSHYFNIFSIKPELAGFTAGRDFHPAPKNNINLFIFNILVNNNQYQY